MTQTDAPRCGMDKPTSHTPPAEQARAAGCVTVALIPIGAATACSYNAGYAYIPCTDEATRGDGRELDTHAGFPRSVGARLCDDDQTAYVVKANRA